MGICEKHQLPLDEHGECELCRLGEMPSASPPARSAWWALIIPLVLLGAAAAWAYSSLGSEPGVTPQRGVPTTEARPASPAPVSPKPTAPDPEVIPPPPTPPSPGERIPIEDIPIPEQRPEKAPEGAHLNAPRDEPVPPAAEQIPEWKWDLARRRVTITMYATQWCGVCRKAREYMDENGIDFMELDTDDSTVAKERLGALNPRKTVPTFEIDELVYIGFQQELFEANLNQAAQKHL